MHRSHRNHFPVNVCEDVHYIHHLRLYKDVNIGMKQHSQPYFPPGGINYPIRQVNRAHIGAVPGLKLYPGR